MPLSGMTDRFGASSKQALNSLRQARQRSTDSGGWTGEQDASASTMMDMAEQQLADMLGAQGGLGLAKMVMTQLGPKE